MFVDKAHPLYQIEWIDAQGDGGWASKEYYESLGATSCYSVGFFLCEDQDSITLVQSLDPANGNVSESVSIPKVCIRQKTRLGSMTKRTPAKDKSR